MRDRLTDDLERLASWRDLEPDDLCSTCDGSGTRTCNSTATWTGGIGGSMPTSGPCDTCWGSGSKSRPWLNLRRLADALRERPDVAEKLRGIPPFIAYPDWSKAGRARFLEAVAVFDAKILRRGGRVGPPEHFAIHFLVECGQREAFAAAAGTSRRPIATEDAPKARVRGESATAHTERLIVMCLAERGPTGLEELRQHAGRDGRGELFHRAVDDLKRRGIIVREEISGTQIGEPRYKLSNVSGSPAAPEA
jgi:hypothetical protein